MTPRTSPTRRGEACVSAAALRARALCTAVAARGEHSGTAVHAGDGAACAPPRVAYDQLEDALGVRHGRKSKQARAAAAAAAS